MCHAPIVVPAVGGDRGSRCAATTAAMREVAQRCVDSHPDRLVLISPHTPRAKGFGALRGTHRGHLGRFRAPEVAVELPDALEVAQGLGLTTHTMDALDHGAMVPLAFLWDAGWRGPTAILSLPQSDADPEAVGRKMADLEGQTAVIASGDMSHRLIEGAPAGHHPDAWRFDAAFVAAIRTRNWAAVTRLPFQQVAAEDVVTSVRVAFGAAGAPLNDELICYEGPFGVGYSEAVLRDPSPAPYAVARRAASAYVRSEPFEVPQGGSARNEPAPVFVTLRDGAGRLRGCMGRLSAVKHSLYAEISDVAVMAAASDPRFDPVTSQELEGLSWEVSILEPPSPILGPEDLDPAVWGAVMLASRNRRAVLLPAIPGVDTVEEQLAVLRRKGRIGPDEPVELQRFAVTKSCPP